MYVQEKFRIGSRATADVWIYTATTQNPVSKPVLHTLNIFCIKMCYNTLIHNVYNTLENSHTLSERIEIYEFHGPIPGYCRWF